MALRPAPTQQATVHILTGNALEGLELAVYHATGRAQLSGQHREARCIRRDD